MSELDMRRIIGLHVLTIMAITVGEPYAFFRWFGFFVIAAIFHYVWYKK